ncbi:MAG: hypothetical protein E7267_05845 [Lachnospiraceae bacterium]|nr:hypothetical protein [Lachnospiraceae bacterium]
MKKSVKKLVVLSLVAAMIVTGFGTGSTYTVAAPKAKKIVMNKKRVNLKVGEKFKLKVKKVKPKKANKKVTYKLNKKGKQVVSVTKKGVITAKAVGTAKIKVKAKKNKKAKAVVKVKVTEGQAVVTGTPVATATAVPSADVKPTDEPKPTEIPTEEPTETPTEKPTDEPKPTAPVATKKPYIPVEGNLIENATFDNGTTGWTTNYDNSGMSVSEEEGDSFLVLDKRWNNYSAARYDLSGLSFNAGETITISYDVKRGEDAPSTDLHFVAKISVNGMDDVTMSQDERVTGSTNEWQTVTATYTFTEDSNNVVFSIMEEPYVAVAGAIIYIDNVSLVSDAIPATPAPAPYEKAGEIKLDASTIWDKLLNVITFGNYELEDPTVTITSDIADADISYYIVTDEDAGALSKEQLDSIVDPIWKDYTEPVTLTSEKSVLYAKIVDPETGYVYYLCTDGITNSAAPTKAPTIAPTVAPTRDPDAGTIEALPTEDPNTKDDGWVPGWH